jgi:hypothetical protein
VVAQFASVPVPSALLGVPVDLGDEAVDVDRQPRLARPGARPPRTGQRLAEHTVELADTLERERAQERAERRRRHRPVPENRFGAPGAQHVAVIDSARPEQQRVDQPEHLASRPQAPGPASLTAPSTRASIPRRRPSATASTIPALTTTRS